MDVLIRADAGADIGMGHAMRSLALAQALLGEGHRVSWVGRIDPASLAARIASQGAGLVRLNEEPGTEGDLAATLRHGEGADWIVVDGYSFGPEYLAALRRTGACIMVVDDAPRFPFYDADLLLDQNLHTPPARYLLPPAGRLLTGPRYALLRPEFGCRPAHPAPKPEPASNILVTMGGSDPSGVTAEVLEAVNSVAARIREARLEVRVVLGHANLRGAEALSRIKSQDVHVEILQSVENMEPLMDWAHLAITAGGSTCWELAAMGVPMIILLTAPNQEPVAAGLDRAGAAISLGPAGSLDPAALGGAVETLLADADRRASMAQRGRQLVDGLGAARVADALSRREARPVGPGAAIRPAAPKDAELLWTWANDPSVRGASFHKDPIPWEDHIQWFTRRLQSPDVRLWILEEQGRPVGQIRYELSGAGDEAVLNFSIAVQERGKGYGEYLVNITKDRALEELGASRISAFVLEGNRSSAKVFLRAGYWFEGMATVNGQRCLLFTWQSGGEEP